MRSYRENWLRWVARIGAAGGIGCGGDNRCGRHGIRSEGRSDRRSDRRSKRHSSVVGEVVADGEADFVRTDSWCHRIGGSGA